MKRYKKFYQKYPFLSVVAIVIFVAAIIAVICYFVFFSGKTQQSILSAEPLLFEAPEEDEDAWYNIFFTETEDTTKNEENQTEETEEANANQPIANEELSAESSPIVEEVIEEKDSKTAFKIYKMTTAPTLFLQGTFAHKYYALHADGTKITTTCNGDQTCALLVPLDWYRNVNCEVYYGNIEDETVKKYTIKPNHNVNLNAIVPYQYEVSQICQLIDDNLGHTVKISNGHYIQDQIEDGERNIAEIEEDVYFEMNFGNWRRADREEIPNTYPNF